MRRLLVVTVAITALTALAAAGPALARKSVSAHLTATGHIIRASASCTPTPGSPCVTRTRVTSPAPPTLAAGQYCNFQVDIKVKVNREYVDTLTFADGLEVQRVTGPLVLIFKNDKTGKKVIRDVSGSTTTIVAPGPNQTLVGTEEGTGNNWWAFGPKSKSNTGEPGLIFTSGFIFTRFVVDLTTGVGVSQSFTLGSGASQVNGCALLA
jgi:hypothetical protein